MIRAKISHYRIVDQIGAGGMGVVYKAFDEHLEREVALKVLRPGLLEEESARNRFRKEALALARLNHPNIATIYEFGSEDGVDFIATEYIQGVTLDAEIAAGPINHVRLLNFGIQLATGLAVAHSMGLIHRDIKPGNLRIAEDGRLKILDFGLAESAPRASDGGLTATSTQVYDFAGTLPYMAPEQLRGCVADVRTDIWAAGAVLHEMATGKPPFPESHSPLLIDAILHLDPAPPSKANQEISSGLDKVILRALEKNTSRRYQTASDLRNDLEHLYHGTEISKARDISTHRLTTKIFLICISLTILIGLIGLLSLRRSAIKKTPNTQRRTVAVLGFKNLGSDQNSKWLSVALSEMLNTELAAGNKLRVVSGEDVSRAKVDLAIGETESLGTETLSKVREILGTNLIVLGSYLDLDGQIRVDVRIQDATNGETAAKFSEVGTETQLFDLVRHIGETLRSDCGAGDVTPEEAIAIRASEPVNTEAAKLYALGLAKLRSFDTMQARDLFTRAIEKDPDYALSHEALAQVWSQLGYDEKAKVEAQLAFKQSANLARRDALEIEGRYRQETREWAKAIDIYHSLWTFFPDDPEYGLSLADAEVSAGHGDDALLDIDRLRKLLGREDPRMDLAESSAAASLSDYKHANAAAERAIAAAKQQSSDGLLAEALLRQCWALRNLGDPERAKKAGLQAGEILGRVGDLRGDARSLTCVADVLADQGELLSAQNMDERALELSRKIGAQKDIAGALINLGNLQAYQGKIQESTRQYQLALALAIEIGDKSDELLAQDDLGANFVLQGNFAAARRSFNDSARTAQEVGDQAGLVEALINMSTVSFVQGDLREAKQDLQTSVEKARELHLDSRLATAIAGMGDVMFAQNDLSGAKQCYEQSLALRRQLGEKGGIAAINVSLAILALEEGEEDQAESMARESLAEFKAENDADQSVIAENVLAKSLIARKAFVQASSEINAAEKLGAHDVLSRLSLSITKAQVLFNTGKNAEAQKNLQEAERSASEGTIVTLEWEARLALADAQRLSGNFSAARANLVLVKKQAASNGFGLYASRATALETRLR